MSTISIVAAVADDLSIGKNQDLLWRMPADMKFFRELTTGHVVIMGRKTFESLPNGSLPNRKNIVLTRTPNADFKNCFSYKSMQEALDSCKQEDEAFIIGGSQLYQQALAVANKMYLTRVHAIFQDADAHFPEVDWSLWEETERRDFPADAKNPYSYSFCTYERKQ